MNHVLLEIRKPNIFFLFSLPTRWNDQNTSNGGAVYVKHIHTYWYSQHEGQKKYINSFNLFTAFSIYIHKDNSPSVPLPSPGWTELSRNSCRRTTYFSCYVVGQNFHRSASPLLQPHHTKMHC